MCILRTLEAVLAMVLVRLSGDQVARVLARVAARAAAAMMVWWRAHTFSVRPTPCVPGADPVVGVMTSRAVKTRTGPLSAATILLIEKAHVEEKKIRRHLTHGMSLS